MNRRIPRTIAATAAGALLLAVPLPVSAHPNPEPRTVVDGLNGPRGVAALGHGATLVADSDGRISLVQERRHRSAKVTSLASVTPGFGAAIDNGRRGTVYILTGAGAPGSGAATLYKWRPGDDEPRVVADIAAYQAGDHDPYDLEGAPEESNPFGVQALRDGTVLVADAAGNDLLRVWPDGRIRTVAVLKPRTVAVPEGFPATDPESGQPLPPAGTQIPSEAVATSVTVGPDGYWYVGELRGFPATPGTSQIWRIRPGAQRAVCDPERPRAGSCQRYADGFTSLVDLAAGRHSVYALSLSKKSWLAAETQVPGAEIGGLFAVRSRGRSVRELAEGQLVTPGGVDVSRNGSVYVTGPVFGPGSLLELRGGHERR